VLGSQGSIPGNGPWIFSSLFPGQLWNQPNIVSVGQQKIFMPGKEIHGLTSHLHPVLRLIEVEVKLQTLKYLYGNELN
jgi:hypothetical protein